ncbi:hypothetical protein C9374_008169 [Naegleria lovaniensis]|uniref:F-box domain-containing protein n=1 Tax=Naegleria lovaniensis TaxID=51637 RepID=A0AA88GKQ9_NAELO|nr:uncharacterized protein C9374_008169 [Naegleria lovaniensis]KAG2378530.1 hypothetical protein C9374_008169 [Naegleria lovaniensis]
MKKRTLKQSSINSFLDGPKRIKKKFDPLLVDQYLDEHVWVMIIKFLPNRDVLTMRRVSKFIFQCACQVPMKIQFSKLSTFNELLNSSIKHLEYLCIPSYISEDCKQFLKSEKFQFLRKLEMECMDPSQLLSLCTSNMLSNVRELKIVVDDHNQYLEPLFQSNCFLNLEKITVNSYFHEICYWPAVVDGQLLKNVKTLQVLNNFHWQDVDTLHLVQGKYFQNITELTLDCPSLTCESIRTIANSNADLRVFDVIGKINFNTALDFITESSVFANLHSLAFSQGETYGPVKISTFSNFIKRLRCEMQKIEVPLDTMDDQTIKQLVCHPYTQKMSHLLIPSTTSRITVEGLKAIANWQTKNLRCICLTLCEPFIDTENFEEFLDDLECSVFRSTLENVTLDYAPVDCISRLTTILKHSEVIVYSDTTV